MPVISLARYARTRNLAPERLAELTRPGAELAGAVRWAKGGIPAGIDTLLADAALAELAPAAPAPDATPPSTRVRVPPPAPTPAPQPRPPPARRRAPEPEDDDEDEPGDHKATGERWRARWARARALKLEGSLVDRGETVREWTRRLAILRSHVMGIPAACKAAMPELTVAQVDALDAVVRAAMVAGEADRGPEAEEDEE